MFHHLVPVGNASVKVLFVTVRQRAHLEEEFVPVRRCVVKPLAGANGSRLGSRAAKTREEVESVRKKERAVVMKVISDEPVGDGGLRRGCFQRRVRVNCADGSVKTWV